MNLNSDYLIKGVTRISPRSSQVGSLSEIKQEGLQEQTGKPPHL